MKRCLRALAAAVACSVSAVPVAEASFPGRNGLLAFGREGPNAETTIWVVDPRTGHLRQLTRLPRRCARRSALWDDSDPSFSASGRLLIYSHSDNCDPRTPDGTYVVRPDGHARRLVTRTVFDRPVFSPSGEFVAFNDEQGRTLIARFDRPERQREVRLRRPGDSSNYQAWSATGQLALPVSNRDGPGHIATLTPEGTNLRLVTRSARDWSPDWSPAADRIAFARWKGDRSDILVTSSRSGDQRRPTRLTHSRNALFPVWSPDGRYIAYLRGVSVFHPSSLVMMRARDGRRTKLITNRVDGFSRISWQPRPRR